MTPPHHSFVYLPTAGLRKTRERRYAGHRRSQDPSGSIPVGRAGEYSNRIVSETIIVASVDVSIPDRRGKHTRQRISAPGGGEREDGESTAAPHSAALCSIHPHAITAAAGRDITPSSYITAYVTCSTTLLADIHNALCA